LQEEALMRSGLFRAVSALVLLATAAMAAEWDPRTFATANTLELRTVGADEGEHWSTVWLVVVDDQVYVRLGSRAAGRIEKNATAPYVGVRVLGRRFDRVKGVSAPEYVDRVAQAMGAKYWSDVLLHYMSHPMTLRLVPEGEGDRQR